MNVASPSTVWQNLRSLYPIFSSLARESVIEFQPCRNLEGEVDVPSAQAIADSEKWITEMDQRIHPHQLRQFLQTSGQMSEALLQQLLAHYLSKQQRTDLDRDKVDFLLVQFFSQHVSPDLLDSDLDFNTSAHVLEPVLGTVEAGEPESLAPLNELLSDASRAQNLNWLLTHRIIERGREIKQSCGEKFFEPAALVAFARFGFLIRRIFFRLMHQDLNTILDGLRELESRGVATLDCRKAQFAADEPIARLRMICQSWKVMFHAEYSSGQPLGILVDLRTAVEAALTHAPQSGAAPIEVKTQAAAAGADPASGSAPEFEVSNIPSTWDGDAGS